MFTNSIICIGDLHGDYDVFVKILKECGLIDSRLKWIGGSTYVIQMGDLLDGKRPGVKIDKSFINKTGEIELMNLVIELNSQAKLKNGAVISLLGNHELYPYYLKNDIKFKNDYIKTVDINNYKKQFNLSRNKFLQPGNLGGELFARTRPLILQLGEFLFIHGSITDLLIENNINSKGYVDISKINKETSNWLNGNRSVPEYLKDMDDYNPLFSRLYSSNKSLPLNDCKKIKNQLSYFKNAKYIVVGHSNYKNINSTCNNKVWRVDVSLSRAFGGTLDNKKLQVLSIKQHLNKEPDINVITI